MKTFKLFLTFSLSAMFNFSFAQTLINKVWEQQTGHPTVSFDHMASARAGSEVIIVGNTYHLGEQENFLITKYNTSGTLLWQKEYNSLTGDRDFGMDVYIKGSYVYVTGFSWDSVANDADMVTLKLTLDSGNLVWSAVYAGTWGGYDAAAGLVVDNSGNVYVAGTEQKGTLDFKMTILKYNSSGTQQWVAHYDSSGYYDGAVAIYLNSTGTRLSATGFSGSAFTNWDFVTLGINMSTGAIGTIARNANPNGGISKPVALTQDFDGNWYVLGATALSPTNSDIKLIKYDTLFNEVWVRTFGSADSLADEPAALTVNPHHRLCITGFTSRSNGATDMLTLAYDKNGNLLWNRSISSTDPSKDAKGRDIKAEATFDGHLYVTGKLDKGSDHDYVTASYTQDGDLRWVTQYDNNFGSDDKAIDLALDENNNPVVSGICVTDTITRYVTVKYKQADAFLPSATDTPSTAYAFYENRGQILVNDSTVADSVFFYTNAGSPQLYVGDKRLSYVIAHIDTAGLTDTIYRIDMVIGSTVSNNREPVFYDKQTGDHLNYFLGNLPEPVTNVKGYNRIVQKEIYRDIDWQLYSTTRGIKSYFVVKPQTDAGQIHIKYLGADSLSIHNNRLSLHTQIGNIRFDSLIAFTVDTLGNRTSVTISYDSVGVNQFGFALGGYNSSEWLVVEQRQADEGERHLGPPEWSTHFGSAGWDEATDVTTDESGNVYVCGFTNSSGLPFVPGFGYHTQQFGQYDAFVSKFGSAHGACCGQLPEGDMHLWTTYFGGHKDDGFAGGDDKAYGVIAKGGGLNGRVYVTGYSESYNLPTFNGAGSYMQSAIKGTRDAFIFSVDNEYGGSSMNERWASYFGGNGTETGRSLAIDGSGNVYMAGSTNTANYSSTSCAVPADNGFPTCNTSGTYSNSNTSGGSMDGFIAKFNSTGNLTWSTFFGKSGDDAINDIVIDGNNRLYVTGKTSSTNMATALSGAYNQAIYGGGANDALIARFSNTGGLDWCSNFGGSNSDEALTITTDNNNNVFIAGTTASDSPACTTCLCTVPGTGEFPLCKSGSPTPYFQAQSSNPDLGLYGGGPSDGFLAKFNSSGEFKWGTYYGGSQEDKITGLALNSQNELFLVGHTLSPSNGTFSGAIHELSYTNPYYTYYYQDELGGVEDAFVGYFNSDLTRHYVSYFGGTDNEWGNAITVYNPDVDNNFWYIVGLTGSLDLKLRANTSSPGAYVHCCDNAYIQNGNQWGNADAFITRFSMTPPYMMGVDVFHVSNTGLDVHVFPNPSSSDFSVQFTVEQPVDVSLELFTVEGQLLSRQVFQKISGNFNSTFNVSELAKGLYLLKINAETNAVVKKIVKHK